MKYEIDEKVIKETTLCPYSFKCLKGGRDNLYEVEGKGEHIICKSEKHPNDHFCYYALKINPPDVTCACYVRKDIFRKYND